MGYIRHQAVVAIVWDSDKAAISAIEELRNDMAKYELGVPGCILGPCLGLNGYNTYCFAPDGSKEGWNTSDQCDSYRRRFMEAVKLAKYPEMVELQFGGDDCETRVLSSTDLEIAQSA